MFHYVPMKRFCCTVSLLFVTPWIHHGLCLEAEHLQCPAETIVEAKFQTAWHGDLTMVDTMKGVLQVVVQL